MVAVLTLPCLGARNIPVASSPFQFPYSKPNLGSPYFLNGTSQTGGRAQVTGSGGYLGLKYAYGNVPMSVGSTTGAGFANNNAMGMFQFAGGVVQSFGVFDYVLTDANPFKYNGGVTNNFYNGGSYSVGFTPNTLWYAPNTIPLVVSQIQYLAKVPFPDVLFANYFGNFVAQAEWDLYSHAGGYTIRSGGILAYQDPTALTWSVVVDVANNSPANINEFVYLAPDDLFPPTNNAIPALTAIGAGLFCPSNTLDNGAGQCLAIMSPKYGNWLIAFEQGLGSPALCAQGAFTGQVVLGTDPRNGERFSINLAVASDQALIAPGNFGEDIRGTVDPAGNFLITPFTNGAAGGLTWIYIMGDLSGYYRINFQPTGAQAAAITTAISNANLNIGVSGGFGIDVNGNFWIMQANLQTPSLYSSVNLNQALNFPPFPQTSAGFVGCRSDVCQYPWFG